jgi:two-component system sensor histidine kinase BaeS
MSRRCSESAIAFGLTELAEALPLRSLTTKLILAFLIVSLIGAALAAVFARWATSREFDRLVLDQSEATFVANLAAYYQANGSWDGVAASLPPPRAPRAQPAPHPRDGGPPAPGGEPQAVPSAFLLVDANRAVVIPAGGYRIGDHVPISGFSAESPVTAGGQVVGTVLATGRAVALDPKEQQYLSRTTQALLVASAISMLVALILGAVLASTLTHPLRELTAATRSVAKGPLGQQVPIRSSDELGGLAESFNHMSADLARANELRREMMADVAHELRTPLTVIAGYIEGLRDGVLQPTPDRFETMSLESQQLKRLVDDLRTLSLAEAGELSLSREATAPQALLERVAAAFSPRAAQAGIALRTAAEAEALPRVDVDPERLVQVLENLVSNAIRHTDPGGEIVLSAHAAGADVFIEVKDDGRGIAPEVLPHVFDRFYRGDRVRGAEGGESGLGLAIAKSIVETHGGTLTASSPGLGQGATFTVRLPAMG